MKVLIIYFSQTGNTEKLAKNIEKGILNSGHTCDITKIKNANINSLDNYDLIGIGTPTFFYREPKNIMYFLQSLKETKGQHCFLFCSHASIIGNTFYYMNKELSEKGFITIGTFDSYGDASLQFYPKPFHTYGHPDEIELNEAIEFGQKICETSKKIQNGESSLIPKFNLISDTWWSAQSRTLTLQLLRYISPEFKINQEKCTQCLVCQNNCPVDAIDIESSSPQIQKEGCIFCWYCEKACPEGAIETSWYLMRKESKENLPRYIEALKKAEKQGKFRPHVDYKNIL